MKHVYGPVPSRRLGLSLGISPLEQKTCNYSCLYCQLGRTKRMTNERREYVLLADILAEYEEIIARKPKFDVATIVGEGEPTLYLRLGELIEKMKEIADVPVAVITNGALLSAAELRRELAAADLVLPSFDAYDSASFRRINRAHHELDFDHVYAGLKEFSSSYQGEIWLELMLMAGINDDEASLEKYKEKLSEINYHRLYLNTPVRPPAETYVKAVDEKSMERAVEILAGISIDLLVSEGFYSEQKDDYEAVLSLIKRHPMNQYEIEHFIKSRGNNDPKKIIARLQNNERVAVIKYKAFATYRLE